MLESAVECWKHTLGWELWKLAKSISKAGEIMGHFKPAENPISPQHSRYMLGRKETWPNTPGNIFPVIEIFRTIGISWHTRDLKKFCSKGFCQPNTSENLGATVKLHSDQVTSSQLGSSPKIQRTFLEVLTTAQYITWRWRLKHRKNCECCPGHYLIVDHYSSI